MTPRDLIDDLRSRINPAYASQLGTESYERRLCAEALEAQADEIDRLAGNMRFEWDASGEPMTFAAAAEDADEWLALIELLHNEGRGPWKFSDHESLEKLRGCRNNLRRFLTPNE